MLQLISMLEKAGFALVEVVIAAVILSVVGLAVSKMFSSQVRANQNLQQVSENTNLTNLIAIAMSKSER